MALAKSVNKLLLAASVFKARLIVVTWYFMFTFRLIYVCCSALEWPRERPLFESDSNKRRGGKTGPLFESSPRPSLKSGLLPLDKHGTCQETITRRLGQMFSASDTGLEWLGEDHYTSWPRINAKEPKLRLLFKSFLDHY